MESETVILIVIGAIVVLLALGFVAWTRRRDAVRDRHREEAGEHRRLASASELEAQQRAAAADERAARAQREALRAEEERLEAMRVRDEAAALHRKADEIDPDVDLDESDDVEAVNGDRLDVDVHDRHAG